MLSTVQKLVRLKPSQLRNRREFVMLKEIALASIRQNRNQQQIKEIKQWRHELDRLFGKGL
jgi:hypothetical protein